MKDKYPYSIRFGDPEKTSENIMTQKDMEDLIAEVSKRRNKETNSLFAIMGSGAKDMYVEHCLAQGLPMFFIEQSITDNGDGTFTITT